MVRQDNAFFCSINKIDIKKESGLLFTDTY